MTLAVVCGTCISVALVIRRRELASVAMITLALYGVFGVAGSVVALEGSDWWLRDVSSENLRLAYFIYNAVGIAFAVCTLVVRPPNGPMASECRPVGFSAEVFSWMVILAAAMVSIVVLFPGSPLYALVVERNTDALFLAELRGALGLAAAESRTTIYFRNLIVGYLLPFCVAVVGVRTLCAPARSVVPYAVACSIYVFCSAIDLAKAPLVFSLALPLLLKAHLGGISRGVIAASLAALCGVVAALYSIVMGAAGGDVAKQALHRVTVAQYAGLPLTLEVFPGLSPHIGLSGGVGALRAITGNQAEFYSRTVMQFANPQGVELGTAGFMSTVSYAEGFAMMGMPGLVAGAIAAIVFVFALDRFRASRNGLLAAFYVVLLLKVPRLFFDSLSALVWNYGILIILAVIGCLMLGELFVLPLRHVGEGSGERSEVAP